MPPPQNDPPHDPGTIGKTAFFCFVGLLVVVAIIVLLAGCGPKPADHVSDPVATASAPVVPPGWKTHGDGPDDRPEPSDVPKGPNPQPYDQQPGDKLVTVQVLLVNAAGQRVDSLIVMTFDAVPQGETGGTTQLGSSHWTANVSSEYRWTTAIRAGYPVPILFSVSAMLSAGYRGDQLSCRIVWGGGELDRNTVTQVNTIPARTTCSVVVSPPPPVA